MPSRIVRSSILDSDRYHSVDLRARLVFLEMLLCADDYGLIPVMPVYLRRHLTALEGCSQEVIANTLSVLQDADLIRCYAAPNSGQYAYIPRFKNWPRAKKPLWPMPPEPVGGNEIKELIKKVHSRCSADTPRMHTETVYRLPLTETVNPYVLLPQLDETSEKDSEVCAVTQATIPKVQAIPFTAILDLYHETLPELPRCLKLTETRRAHIRQRWASGDMNSTDDWRAYFVRVKASKFLTGKATATPGHKVFRADLEWLVKDGNCAKVWEGRYDG